MKTNKTDDQVGKELKYCEHCGGLYVRECGAGVYCNRCRAKVEDLPIANPKKRRIVLPVLPETAVEGFEFEIDIEDVGDLEGVGGVA